MANSFFGELKRRNVFRVAAIYAVVGWLLMQIGDVMFPALRLPEWTPTLLVAFLILGLPIALIFAWAFELTPDGVVRTGEVPPDSSITTATGQRSNYMIIGVLALAVAFLLARMWLFDESAPEPAAVAVDRSIAVLPFKNQSASKENAEFFSGGLHDELLTLLSRIGDLKVISRTSVERLDSDLSIPEIGALLGVATVLEGQVQRAGDRLRINVQLIDTAEEGHIWANTYDSELKAENVFEVQADIARTIAGELQATLSPDDEQLLARVGTSNFEALENYLLGAQLEKQGSFALLEEAVERFRIAIELDPDYAEAWVGLAQAYSSQHNTGAIETEAYSPAAKNAIDRALALDSTIPRTHALLGIWYMRVGDMESAERSLREALRLNPDDSDAIGKLGLFLRTTDQPNAAVDVLEKALAIDPLSLDLLFQLAKSHLYAGRPERALDISEHMREIDPSFVGGSVLRLQAHLWSGRFDKLFPAVMDTFARDSRDHELWAHFANQMNELGFADVADRYMAGAEQLSPGGSGVLRCKAVLLDGRGDFEAAYRIALEALDSDVDDRWGSERIFLRLVGTKARQIGSFDGALRRYRESFPGLFEKPARLDIYNIFVAGDLGLLLRKAGRKDEGDSLIRSALEWQRSNHPRGAYGYYYGVVGAELLALDGQGDEAIAELQRAVESGWRFEWRYILASNGFDSIRDREGFRRIVDALESDMQAQAGLVRALPDFGRYDFRDLSAS